MRLYVDIQLISPYAMCAFVALTEKRLAFDLQTVDLAGGAQHGPEYAKASLTHRVPTLVDGDFALAESSAIVEYLDEAYPRTPRLFPTELRARAKARQIQAWLRSDFVPIRQDRNTQVVFHRPVAQPLSAAAQASADKLFAAATDLLAHGRDCLFGDWSIADVDLALMLNRLVLNGDEVPGELVRYAARQWARPSVQSWVRLKRPSV